MSYRRRVALPLVAVTCAAVTLPLSAVAAPSAGALIAEVYGGGGNAGATLTSDFVELANAGTTEVPLAGWSVQYLSASPSPTSRWQATPLTGSLGVGKRYLLGLAKGAGGTTALPTPDATGTTNMSGTAGTVALVQGTEPLTCLTAADCAADARIRDLVGYGGATVREGSPAAATANATSSARRTLVDTDDNSADLATGDPTPVNAKGEGPGGGEPGPTPQKARIHQVQGTTRISPLRDKLVEVPGVVTAVRSFGSARGFWVQDTAPDGDPRTSEGLFVFTGPTTPAVAVGDDVLVTGTVAEFYPTASGETPQTTPNQSVTQLTKATWNVLGSGKPLPAAEVLKPDTVPAVLTASPGGTIEALPLEPGKYGLDFLESREGMRLRVDDARVVGATDGFNALWVTSKPAQNATARGGTNYTGYAEANTGRLKVESLLPFAQRPFPKADVGDLLRGVTEGPLDYNRFGGYVLQASALGEHVPGGLVREVTRKQKEHELAVATYNVENLSPVDDAAKFTQLAEGIVKHLASPDVVVLEEIQDDNGPANDAVVSADATLKKFTEFIVTAGGPKYEWRQINPNDDQDGGQPGGNIRVGFLFNPARVSFVDRPGGDANTPVTVEKRHGRAQLSVSPGRIEPANEAWANSRKPLAGEFRFPARGPLSRTVFVVANHFASKGGDQPLHGRFQEPNRSSEVQRLKQAALLRSFADSLRATDRDANLVIAGDLNDFVFSPALRTLLDGPVLHAPMNDLPPGERYSYVFDGNSQTLDHILVNSKLAKRADLDVVHINAEFHVQASDHDPQVVRFRPRTGNALLDALEDLADCLRPGGN
ncbi:putative extracellular nuclease [Crossiella equi]|uniref:Extracellular nuclease n=2 Tax=Crossiella equi TaxID=130796 RepID=A0ABS5AFH2_9PSEU|nr:endonuclease/exonuclease/phosphatase family protein [Crossiella equi]MBP2475336.1 putative extracellular nuclease [Crossiella equi]